jgi:predicted phosphodiesterase
MKYAVLSDVHGNLPALDAILRDLSREQIDRILIAGDLVSGCPYPSETVARLRELQTNGIPTHIIRGNNEGYLLSMQRGDSPPGMLTSRQWGTTRWTWQQLGQEGMDWIGSLPFRISLDGPDGALLMLHGSPRRESEGLIPDRDPVALKRFFSARLLDPAQTNVPLASTLERLDEVVLICGHTHIPWEQREGRKLAFNPGSVGAPVNGDPRAQYALLEYSGRTWQVHFRAVAYDIPALQAAFITSGLLEAGGGFARAIQLDLERADNTVWKFVLHCLAYAQAAGMTDGQVIPDETWLEAEKSYKF